MKSTFLKLLPKSSSSHNAPLRFKIITIHESSLSTFSHFAIVLNFLWKYMSVLCKMPRPFRICCRYFVQFSQIKCTARSICAGMLQFFHYHLCVEHGDACIFSRFSNLERKQKTREQLRSFFKFQECKQIIAIVPRALLLPDKCLRNLSIIFFSHIAGF